MMRRRAVRPGGFTLIEILIVVVILGVLAILGVAKHAEFTTQARIRACAANANSIDSNVGVWESQNVAIPSGQSNVTFDTNGVITAVGGTAAAISGAKNSLSTAVATATNANNQSIARLVKDQNLFCCPERAHIAGGVQALHSTVENDFNWRQDSASIASLGNRTRGTECCFFGTGNGPDGTTSTAHR